jgi:Ca2+-transporting ATPase
MPDLTPPRGAASAPHSESAADVARALGADPTAGLSEEEVRERLSVFGANETERRRRPAYIAIAARQLVDPLVLLLVVASAISFLIGEQVEAVAIAAIVLLNGVLGFGQEAGAERAILALRETLEKSASVVREGREREIAAAEVVPGDVLVLREGERVAADGRLVDAEGLAVDESLLTGESMPVEKQTAPVSVETPLAERSSLVFAGTAVTRGRARALVTATGARAEIGEVARLAASAKAPPTPLQQRLGRLTSMMVVLAVAITALLTVIAVAQGSPLDEAFLIGVSVAVAAVPEGLAATVTIALALGARRMAALGAITRRLPAVETLGSTTVVASDKTGTLTQNRLRVRAVAPSREHDEEELLRAAVLASTATVSERDGELHVSGDPVEGAILRAAREHGISSQRLRAQRPIVRELPFDPDRKRMTLVYEEEDGIRAFTKGAPEVLLDRSNADAVERSRLEETANSWAEDGLRVLAVAQRTLQPGQLEDEEALDSGLEILGLVALHDPLRETARGAIREARAAGLRIQILTGDHPATAAAVARELDLPEDSVSARVTPAEKLRLVERLQSEGEIVAVTGDGVNDAPALRRANVGVAMGRSGTETAREASDLVLTNDDFSTIVAAIREGRGITDNVRKFVAFLLSANLGEVLLFAIAVVVGLGAPMTVVQVLAVNVLTDGFPAVALAGDPPPPQVMQRRPERGARLFGRESWAALALVGALVGAAALGAFLVGRSLDEEAGQTMAFATIALGELIVVFAVRSPIEPAWRGPRNPYLFMGVATSALLLALSIYLPFLHGAFGSVALDSTEVAVVVGFAALPFALIEGAKAVLRRRVPTWASPALQDRR